MYIVEWRIGQSIDNEAHVRVTFDDAGKASRYFEARHKQFDALLGKVQMMELDLKYQNRSTTEKMASLRAGETHVFLPISEEMFDWKKYLELRKQGEMRVRWNNSVFVGM